MKRIFLLLAVIFLSGCYVRYTQVERGSEKIADSKIMVSVHYHTGPATLSVAWKDDERDLRLLRPIPNSAMLVSQSGIQYILDFDPDSVRYNGSSSYSDKYGERVWISFDFAHPHILGASELQDLPVGDYVLNLAFSGVPNVSTTKVSFSLVKSCAKVNWGAK